MLEKIREILEEYCLIKPCDIKENSDFSKDLGLSSLDLYHLGNALEEEFKIPVPEALLFSLKDVGSLAAFLAENVKEA